MYRKLCKRPSLGPFLCLSDQKLMVTDYAPLSGSTLHSIQYPGQRLVLGVPRDLCQLAYREVGLLLAGAPLAEGYVLDRHHRWAPARIVRTATHLARSQPLGHLSQEILLCLVRPDILCCRTNSYLFIDTRYAARSCSLEHCERGVTQGSLQPSPRLRLRSRDQRGRLRRRTALWLQI